MTISENRRKSPDRRVKKSKNFPNDKRKGARREEDVANVKIYYYLLFLLTVILFYFGISACLNSGLI